MSGFDAYSDALNSSLGGMDMEMDHFDKYLTKPAAAPARPEQQNKDQTPAPASEPKSADPSPDKESEELEREKTDRQELATAMEQERQAQEDDDDRLETATSRAQDQDSARNDAERGGSAEGSGAGGDQSQPQPQSGDDAEAEHSFDDLEVDLGADAEADAGAEEDPETGAEGSGGPEEADADDPEEQAPADSPEPEPSPVRRKIAVASARRKRRAGEMLTAPHDLSEVQRAEEVGLIWPKGLKMGSLKAAAVFQVKMLPKELSDALVQKLADTVVYEANIDPSIALPWARRFSGSAIVMAYLCAHLGLDLDIDAATAQAVDFFRVDEPVLGAVLQRLDEVNEVNNELAQSLREHARGSNGKMRELEKMARSSELGLSFLLADRAENLTRGLTSAAQLPFEEKEESVLDARKAVRAAARGVTQREKDRIGRDYWDDQ